MGLCLVPWSARAEIPSFAEVRAAYATSDLLLLDRQGAPLQQVRVDAHRRRLAWSPLESISVALVPLLLAAEDRHFWQHDGVAWQSVLGAIRDRLVRGVYRGASTLTMQLAALLDPQLRPGGGRRTWRMKWAQMRAAWQMENRWSKAQILEAYLNLVTFRGELQGIHAASRGLFDKQPSGLERAEALLLVALVRSPNARAEKAATRACALARRHAPDLPCDSLRALADRHLATALAPLRLQASWAPHVAQRLLAESPGADGHTVLRSTLDGPLQRFTLDVLNRQLQQLQHQHVQDGAALVVDNASGQVLAYVGHAGPAVRAVDGVQAPRQAGSTLKPFLYQLALEQRWLTAASLLEDSPVEVGTERGSYQPQNYDRRFRGWVSVRTALAASLNIPAVRTLMLTGLNPFVARLQQLGLTHVRAEGVDYGYALALGSVEVSLWQLVNAYRTLANGGLFTPLTLLSTPPASEPRRLFSAPASFIVADLLADPAARSATFGLDSPLVTPFWSAVKTGTSKRMRDNWCVGFTRHYTVGVWVGNFDGEPMRDVSGVSGAAPAWLEIMTYLHPEGADARQTALSIPAGVTQRETDFTPPLEPPRSEWFVTGTEMTHVSLVDADSRPPRILYPQASTILAMDPDIPAEQQRLLVRMEPMRETLRWQMDDQPLDPAEGWLLAPGYHQLALIDEEAQAVDTVRFFVRGYPKKSATDEEE
ncbi:MAG: penicillin-binding protein 1C [Magnetococcales bacterium]|nr:penicillin-binding protein 1C [Magnetococcales bacterium]